MAPSVEFKITRCNPVLVAPADKTPHEMKYLSDIDDQVGLRFQMPVMQFFCGTGTRRPEDPVKVIKEALAKALVFYYPFAGRLREEDNRKLAVDCNAEGVLFIEAQANVTMPYFGDMLYPPFPHMEKLLSDVPGSGHILGCPLLLMQVTRLACGGFIIATRFNHSICDGAGIAQFLATIAEIARGAKVPTVLPVWCRELLCARDPPRVTCNHRHFEEVQHRDGSTVGLEQLVHRSFIFTAQDIAVLRHKAQPEAGNRSTFELLTACLWKCRTAALCLDPGADCRVIFAVDIRSKICPPLPDGYYGNASPSLAAVATAGELQQRPLSYAVKLVSDVKSEVNNEFMRSLADFIVLNGREVPTMSSPGTFYVSDTTGLGLRKMDFGWGQAAYSGPGVADNGHKIGQPSAMADTFYVLAGGANGKKRAIGVGIGLPCAAMERFAAEIKRMVAMPSCSAVPCVNIRSRM